jgi:hypothetical protein
MYYQYITDNRQDSLELRLVMEATAADLLAYRTNEIKPGILLGLIQSGKTRAFVGVIAKCFDTGYDVSVVFTKNSVALVDQTLKRLRKEFSMPIERNRLYVWDVMSITNLDQLTGYILSNKIIFVVKKEINNLNRLHDIFEHPGLSNKNILVVDDEADQTSVSFIADEDRQDEINYARIAEKIVQFRTNHGESLSFLQVTATPYSLYLQPTNPQQESFAPLRPVFTHLLQPHPAYIGGNYYFEESLNVESPAYFLHVNVPDDQLDTLNQKPKTRNRYDQRLLNNILTTPSLLSFREAIYRFILGGAIRQHQEKTEDYWSKPYHCAFILHTSTTTAIHAMQKHLLETFLNKVKALDIDSITNYFLSAYENMSSSIIAAGLYLPEYDTVIERVVNALKNNYIGIVEVNSENQVAGLLGDDGQLRLDNPFNIFVGGQSLDRGITIDHLIGFFYGRNPRSFQMDTVLQHSRMYGSRSKKDLAVTRFYTSARIYEAMRRMHHFDKDLRELISRDGSNALVHFIAKNGTEIIPCGPNKLRASSLCSFRAFSRMLPIGFQTRSNTDINPIINTIDSILFQYGKGADTFQIPIEDAIRIVELIQRTFLYEPRYANDGLEWNIAPVIKALEIGCLKHQTDQIIIYHKTNRRSARYKQGQSFSDAPDDGRTDLPISRNLAQNAPVLMMLKQLGRDLEGWRNAEFYWPVIIMPSNMPSYVYTDE